ncbi:hypothetical protein KC19_1G177000 [Ceratodon purpureus]|uniref:Uncharacterized protein n=1 Tax=Ceratodon purpureus TaxID=3225 RepID=A0A8T0J9N8_CERPU|nr:hypothetical protein KC19_1G177000 [Ceratodon purpureus]
MTLRNRLQGSLNGQIDGDNLAKGGIFGNLPVEHWICFWWSDRSNCSVQRKI